MNQLTIFLKFQVQNVLKSFEEVATNLPDEIRKGNILNYHLCDDLKVISFLSLFWKSWNSMWLFIYTLAGAAFLIPLETTDSTDKMVNLQQFKEVSFVLFALYTFIIWLRSIRYAFLLYNCHSQLHSKGYF